MAPPRSLQGRLLAMVLGLVAGVWLATAWMTWLDARHELEELLDGHLAQAAALLVVQQQGEIEDEHHGVDAPTLHRYAPKVAFQVFHEGRLALRSANAPALPMTELTHPINRGFGTVNIDGQAWRVFAARGAETDVQVYVGERVDSRTSILWAVLRSTLWPMVLALPLLALAVWGAVHRGVRPLRQLGRVLSEREPQALHPLTLEGAPSEMTPMVDALNQLFERMATLLASERRFTADAAHELRTPIAAIRTQAQVALAETDEALRRHALEGTLEGCDRATRLVAQLLTLSRLEADGDAVAQQVDLVAITRQVVADLAPVAMDKRQTLAFDAGQACRIPGNETLLTVLVRNLVDNAVRYSPTSARIKVSLEPQGPGFVLSVQDSGPGMSDADQSRLGDRFFRVLGSGQSGSGLGWSIVRRIAAAHHLALEVGRSVELGGLAVRIRGRLDSG